MRGFRDTFCIAGGAFGRPRVTATFPRLLLMGRPHYELTVFRSHFSHELTARTLGLRVNVAATDGGTAGRVHQQHSAEEDPGAEE